MKQSGSGVIECCGSAYEIGVQYGAAAKDNIHRGLHLLARQLSQNPFHIPADFETAIRCARIYLKNVQAFDPEGLNLVRGTAEGADITFDEAFALYCYTELIFNFHILAGMCTSFAVTGPATCGGKTILGQNIDWHPDTPFDLVHIRHAGGLEQLSVTFFGAFCYSLTSAGLANCANLTLTLARPVTTQIPLSLYLYSAMRRPSLDEAFVVLQHAARGMGYYHLADSRGRIRGIESVSDDFTVLEPKEGVLVHANHYETGKYAEYDVAPRHIPDSFHRASRLRALIGQHYGSITPEVMMRLLADHDGHPHSVCTHVDTARPYDFAVISAASVIMVPEERRMFISLGPPCENNYVNYGLDP
ncbi:MAG: C45 family peptidase [Syntrophobacteraceae bacterium]